MEKKISFAVKGLITKENKILIMKRSDAGIWELPGGRLEFGETAEETLIREMSEETGLEVQPHNIVGTWNKFFGDWQITGIIYTCTALDYNITISSEHSDYKWVSINSPDFELLHPIYKDKIKLLPEVL
ncbi:MAG: NUDIX domain-containing protein [Spirochaetaceae bacterium]